MLALKVKCPKCGASPGSRCVGRRKSPQLRKTPHIERMRIAQERPSNTAGIPNKDWAALRAKVFSSKGHRCFYCGKDASHVDHKTPLRRGGSNNIGNLVPCCAACNIAKGSTTADEFMGAPQ